MIILGVTEHLGGDFSLIRDYIEQEISNMFEDFTTLMDIKDFQAKLVTEFTSRNQIKIFRNKDVPAHKKQPNVNTSGFTEEKKKDPKADTFIKEYEK